MTITVLGDTALLVEVTKKDAPAALVWVQQASTAIREARWPEVVEVVPALSGFAIHFHSSSKNLNMATRVRQKLESGLAVKAETPPLAPRDVDLSVCYEGEYAPDLSRAAAQANLRPDALAAAHAAGTYMVQAIGFSPGFPYLTGLGTEAGLPTPSDTAHEGRSGQRGNWRRSNRDLSAGVAGRVEYHRSHPGSVVRPVVRGALSLACG